MCFEEISGMNQKIFRGKYILVIVIPLWVFLGIILIIWNKAEIHLFLNQYHSVFFDTFFRSVTFLGDGLMILILFIICLFFTFKKTLSLGVSGTMAGLLAQFFKRAVFSDCPRPKAFFEGISNLYFVPGVDIHTSYSFPSGHAATAFALFISLALFSSNKLVQSCLILLAILTAYSRIYLSQHFLVDIYFGGLLGILVAFIIYYFFNRFNNKWINKSIVLLVKNDQKI